MKIKDATSQLERGLGKDLLHPHGEYFVAWDTIADELLLAQQLKKNVEELQEQIRFLQIENADLEAQIEEQDRYISDLEFDLANLATED